MHLTGRPVANFDPEVKRICMIKIDTKILF